MLIFCALAGVAAYEDYCSRRIPNGNMLCMLLWGTFYSFWRNSVGGVLAFWGIMVLVVCIAFPLYRIGSIGAGDVKLIALCCGFLGPDNMLFFLFFSLLIAAIFSICKVIKYGMAKERLVYFGQYLSEVRRKGRWVLYIDNQREFGRVGICMAGPVFFSLLLHLGGVY